MELTLALLLGFLLLLVFLLKLGKNRSSLPPLRLPPGPWQLPVIGSLHHLLLSRSGPPHRAMRELSRRHGPLMFLRLGAVPTMVVSSAEAAREIMKTQDAAFASRHLTPTLDVFTGGRGILFSPYGDLWRQLRRLCVHELFSAHRVQSYRHIREDEVARLLRSVEDACSGGAAVDLGERIYRMTNDVVVRGTVGGRCARRDELLRELDVSVRLSGGFNMVDLYPSSWLLRRLSSALREAEQCKRHVNAILEEIMRGHAVGPDDGEEDLLGVLLRVQRDGGVQCPLTTEIITTVIMEIFFAGSETSSTTLEWAMSELMRNPQVLRKAQSEVRESFMGQERLTEGDGIHELSYLGMVIKEILRLHMPAPFLLPRECRETCQVMGYDIPKGTRVLVNAWAIGTDSKYWDDAEMFRPERFGASNVDFRGNDLEYIPFGAGRRMCPGLMLGLANMELALASLLYHFDWELPNGVRPEELDMSEKSGGTVRRKSKLWLHATTRVPLAN